MLELLFKALFHILNRIVWSKVCFYDLEELFLNEN